MNALNNVQQIDRSNMLQLLTSFPKQFQEARQIGASFDLKIDRDNIKHLLFAGMGGSAIGGDLIISCLSHELTIPALVIRNYFLPHFVDQSSLVIVSSYSGNTEESLSCYQEAKREKAQIVCITSGGQLAEQARYDGMPLVMIPGGAPPRTALGYLSIPILILLARSGFTMSGNSDLDETEKLLWQKSAQYSPAVPDNFAYSLAQKLEAKIPILYSSVEFLEVVGRRWKGQFSENAKVLAFMNVFPELNHNEIVGWERLGSLLKNFQIIYLRDKEDYERIQKRMAVSRQILEGVTCPVIELVTEGKSRLTRLFSLIYSGDWVSYYLALINGLDPTPVEKIQILKDKLDWDASFK